jgi:hypothetical protein
LRNALAFFWVHGQDGFLFPFFSIAGSIVESMLGDWCLQRVLDAPLPAMTERL